MLQKRGKSAAIMLQRCRNSAANMRQMRCKSAAKVQQQRGTSAANALQQRGNSAAHYGKSAAIMLQRCGKMRPYRCADLPVSEEQLIASGKHVLVSYVMKPKAGYDRTATRTSP